MESLKRKTGNLQVDSRASCCNQQPNSPCPKIGSLACQSCLMVFDCQSLLLKGTWKPRWMTQNRRPAFIGGSETQVVFGTVKYLWGNVPAIDVIQLAQNEGINF
ncbi:hypothetical protein F4824DRAFT_500409 [Ustulina deusta]|nr:hypothetical protein F4824DRAFT_500409 [Ustulina deusta]